MRDGPGEALLERLMTCGAITGDMHLVSNASSVLFVGLMGIQRCRCVSLAPCSVRYAAQRVRLRVGE